MKKLVLMLSILVGTCSCNGSPSLSFYNYDDIRENLISWSNIFVQPEEYYLVYFYSERCVHCNEIKQEIINFYLEDIIPMYFVCTNIEVKFGPKSELKGIDNIDDFYIFGTPFLVEFKSWTVNQYYAGLNEVKEFISILKN